MSCDLFCMNEPDSVRTLNDRRLKVPQNRGTPQTHRLRGPLELRRRFLALGFQFSNLPGECRHNREQVANDAIVGKLEDGGLRIFIDGNDVLGR